MRCDSHVHIVARADKAAQVPERGYLAGEAPLDALQRNGAAHGIGRFVVVQPSFYGTDNTVTLESVAALGDGGRAVAVIDPNAASPESLDDLHRRGVRGLRINLYSGVGVAPRLSAALAAHADPARAKGWHVELIANLPLILDNEATLATADVPLVLDHYALPGRVRPGDPEGRRLLALLRHPHIWIKLSGPYRTGDDPLAIEPDREWLAAIVEAAPDRSVWGSDWPWAPPHAWVKGPDVPAPYRALSYPAMFGAFVAALPSGVSADTILSDNPAQLYGF